MTPPNPMTVVPGGTPAKAGYAAAPAGRSYLTAQDAGHLRDWRKSQQDAHRYSTPAAHQGEV